MGASIQRDNANFQSIFGLEHNVVFALRDVENVLSFLDFLSIMKGKYHEATFKEKRNALDVLGVTVQVSPAVQASPAVTHVVTDKEWLSLVEAGELAGVSPKVVES